MSSLENIGSLRLRDFEILVEVGRAKSIREAARRLGSTPGQISKAIQHAEKKLGLAVFKRSAYGVLQTAAGGDILKLAQSLVLDGQKMAKSKEVRATEGGRQLAIAGTAFLNVHFITPAVCRSREKLPKNISFRFLDLAPDQMSALGLRGAFDLAVHYGGLAWPRTWVSEKIGRSPWVLCAREGHKLPVRPSLKQVLEQEFVMPAYWTAEGLVQGNDQFPVSVSRRQIGYETATADAAIPILENTEQLAFLPFLLVQSLVADGRLKILKPAEVPVVERELFLSARSDVVPAAVYSTLVSEFGNALKAALRR